MSLLDDANLIVSEREHAYHMIMADLYFMALLDNNRVEAAEIWREAQMFDSFFLSTALANARRQANSLIHLPRSHALTRRSHSHVQRRQCFGPLYRFRRR